MFEIKLHLHEATLGQLRRFVNSTTEFEDNYPIASYDENHELDGICAIVDDII